MARPPSTYDGRTSTGYPIRSAAARASSTFVAVPFGGCVSPSSRAIASNRRRSSAMSIASGDVPRIFTPAARRLALLVVAAIEIGRGRRELAGTGVDHLVRRADAERPAAFARLGFGLVAQVGELPVRKAQALHAAHRVGADFGQRDIRA